MELSVAFTRSLLAGFGRSYSDLLRIATRSTGSRDAARDLVHDVWLRLAEHERQGGHKTESASSAPHDVTAYLAVMAQHMALDGRRREQLLTRHVDASLVQAQIAPEHAPDVADGLMYRQALVVLEQTLASLPERTRQVFAAHRVQGEKQADIAARMGLSLNTVERDLMQASDCIEDALMRWRGEAMVARRSGRRRSLTALLGVAGVGVGGVLGWRVWDDWRSTHVQWQATWNTPRGRQQRHALPDGSHIVLDAASTLQVQYFAGRRVVILQAGAAFFEVARDEERPFTVQAQGVLVTVLGTRFGVEIAPDAAGAPQVRVQVESGRVRVDPGAGTAAVELGAGDAVQVREGAARREDMAGVAASWRTGELVLTGATLGEALWRIQRYAPFALAATPQAAALPVHGRVRIARAEAWVQALPRALPVQVRSLDGGGLQVAMRSSPGAQAQVSMPVKLPG